MIGRPIINPARRGPTTELSLKAPAAESGVSVGVIMGEFVSSEVGVPLGVTMTVVEASVLVDTTTDVEEGVFGTVVVLAAEGSITFSSAWKSHVDMMYVTYKDHWHC